MGDQALQQVIDELKSRGLRAGEDEGRKKVDEAEQRASQIVAAAKAEAEGIVGAAKTEAGAMREQMRAELRQASAVGLEAFRQAVEKSFLVPTVDKALQRVLDDPAELRAILVETVKGFAASGGTGGGLEVILPEAQRAKLEGAVQADLARQTGTSVTVRFDDGFSFGFRLSPESSGYLFDFSDDGFREIYLKFLAPRFREYFFQK